MASQQLHRLRRQITRILTGTGEKIQQSSGVAQNVHVHVPSELVKPLKVNTFSSLKYLQTEEQRRLLDTVSRIRNCGLDSILSLPQLVVCGDQSAGKSSVLEALTEIPFPRDDNLCTRFATEIILKHAEASSMKVSVIPGYTRSRSEQEELRTFNESITDFTELPKIIGLAKEKMGLASTNTSEASGRAFSFDVLRIEVAGPSQLQLTLVDIPGLIQTSTKGVSDQDVSIVAKITKKYILSPRTICLAVIAATNDAANQVILRKVRQVDPNGDRTLGIITKPDLIPAGSGSENKVIELARNKNVFFKLGWHVLKNRSYEETASSLPERNKSEVEYFRTSNFSSLPKEKTGIESLRSRLSLLLFAHVKKELPQLREDVESTLLETRHQLKQLGSRRSTAAECKSYLIELGMGYHDTCKAAVRGHYEGPFFRKDSNKPFSLESPATTRRLRAVIQYMNNEFSETIRTTGHKYHINMENTTAAKGPYSTFYNSQKDNSDSAGVPIKMSRAEAMLWVRETMLKNRGQELQGNFNPLLIGELFHEQSSYWEKLATKHIEAVAQTCLKFVDRLLIEHCPTDVKDRLWHSHIRDTLMARCSAAFHHLNFIMEDMRGFPINYNHYYTDTIHSLREKRQRKPLKKPLGDLTSTTIDIDKDGLTTFKHADPDMDNVSAEEAIDCLFAIYKVYRKVFVANLTVQVIERHMIRGLEDIFSPLVVNALSDKEAEALAAEPGSVTKEREYLGDRIGKLMDGKEIFRELMVGSMV